jgi:hypothetical protein
VSEGKSPTTEDIPARIEAILRGEHKAALEATPIPPWYGQTAVDACNKWLDMWERSRATQPQDESFYQSNAIGWASRP